MEQEMRKEFSISGYDSWIRVTSLWFWGLEGDALLSPPYTAFLIPGLAKSDVVLTKLFIKVDYLMRFVVITELVSSGICGYNWISVIRDLWL